MTVIFVMTHPSGCCIRETRSSTAEAPAIAASPGLVTVHIWSKVLSVNDCGRRKSSCAESVKCLSVSCERNLS